MTVKELMDKLLWEDQTKEVVFSSYGECIQMKISGVEIENDMNNLSKQVVAIQGD